MWTASEIRRPKAALRASYVDVSPDGVTLVLGVGASSRDTPAVVVCDAASGDVIGRYCEGRTGIAGVAYAEHARAALALFHGNERDERELVRIELASGRLDSVGSIATGAFPVALTRSRGGEVLATMGNKLGVWDARTGAELWSRAGGPDANMRCCLDPTGARLYEQGTEPSRVVQWDIRAQRALARWPAPAREASWVSISSDEERLCVAAGEGNGTFVIEPRSGARIGTAWFNESAPADRHLFLPDGSGLVHPSMVLTLPEGTWSLIEGRPRGIIIDAAAALDVPRVVMTTDAAETFWVDFQRA